MGHSTPHRRAFLGTTAVGALALIASWPADALEAPASKVILTVSGPVVTNANDNGAASFDLPMLQKLPQQSFSTKTPWFPQPRKFTGVLLRDVIVAVGASPGAVKAVALNDYRVDIPKEDVNEQGVMLAYWIDDRPMPVREKGPLVIIYPFDDKPDLRTALHYSRAVWQLRSLELR
jgi:hypothetical protein